MTRRTVPTGTTAQVQSVPLLSGEVMYDTTAKRLRVGDGATAGGAMVDSGLREALAKPGGAAMVLTADGTPVETALADRPTTSTLAQMEANASAAADRAEAASIAGGGSYPSDAADHVPIGVNGYNSLAGGTGGANGTFALAFTGGNFLYPPSGTFTVTGGAVTEINITGPGLYIGASPTAPTPVFSASSGLTGASATLTTDYLIGSGKSYRVQTEDGNSLDLYYNNAGTPEVSDPLDRVPQTGYIASIAGKISESTVGSATVDTSATPYSNHGQTFFRPNSLQNYDQVLETLRIAISAGGGIEVVVAKVESDGTLTLISSTPFNMAVGVNTVAPNVIVPAGHIYGVYYPTSGLYYVAGAIPAGDALWTTTGLPSDHTAKTVNSTNAVVFNATLVGDVAGKARIAYDTADQISSVVGSDTAAGWPDPIASTGSVVPTGYTIIAQTAAPADGIISQLRIGTAAAASTQVLVVSVDPVMLSVTIHSRTSVDLSAGVNTVALNIPIEGGQYPCVVGGGYLFQNGNNPLGIPIWYKGSPLNDGDVVANGAQHRFEVGWTIKTGMKSDIAKLAVTNDPAGLSALSSADATGGSDATAIFAAARSNYPSVFVPQGTFSVTSLPDFGDGFYGPGIVKVGGVVASLPLAPEAGSRFLRMRAALMAQIATGSALIYNHDSIGNGAYADNPQANFVGLTTRFANMGIAVDEAVFVNFDDADTSSSSGPGGAKTGIAFHGIALSNPATVTNGAGGPVGKSLLLQPGQVMTLDEAAYERIDVTYTGVSDGQLAFAYDGVAYKTVTCATSGSDVLAAAGATGQTASGTYTITNTGSVAVEITALMRFGVKAAGTPPRLYVCRFGHGGYQFNSYSAPRIASMMRIATAIAGGTNHFLVPALGTNDSVGSGLDYADMKSHVSDYIAAWVAAGLPVKNMLPIMPWRWAYYPGTTSYEQALAGVRDAYREAGIKRVIQTDAYDFISQGMTKTGDGHPNDAGHIAEFNAVVAALCRGDL